MAASRFALDKEKALRERLGKLIFEDFGVQDEENFDTAFRFCQARLTQHFFRPVNPTHVWRWFQDVVDRFRLESESGIAALLETLLTKSLSVALGDPAEDVNYGALLVILSLSENYVETGTRLYRMRQRAEAASLVSALSRGAVAAAAKEAAALPMESATSASFAGLGEYFEETQYDSDDDGSWQSEDDSITKSAVAAPPSPARQAHPPADLVLEPAADPWAQPPGLFPLTPDQFFQEYPSYLHSPSLPQVVACASGIPSARIGRSIAYADKLRLVRQICSVLRGDGCELVCWNVSTQEFCWAAGQRSVLSPALLDSAFGWCLRVGTTVRRLVALQNERPTGIRARVVQFCATAVVTCRRLVDEKETELLRHRRCHLLDIRAAFRPAQTVLAVLEQYFAAEWTAQSGSTPLPTAASSVSDLSRFLENVVNRHARIMSTNRLRGQVGRLLVYEAYAHIRSLFVDSLEMATVPAESLGVLKEATGQGSASLLSRDDISMYSLLILTQEFLSRLEGDVSAVQHAQPCVAAARAPDGTLAGAVSGAAAHLSSTRSCSEYLPASADYLSPKLAVADIFRGFLPRVFLARTLLFQDVCLLKHLEAWHSVFLLMRGDLMTDWMERLAEKWLLIPSQPIVSNIEMNITFHNALATQPEHASRMISRFSLRERRERDPSGRQTAQEKSGGRQAVTHRLQLPYSLSHWRWFYAAEYPISELLSQRVLDAYQMIFDFVFRVRLTKFRMDRLSAGWTAASPSLADPLGAATVGLRWPMSQFVSALLEYLMSRAIVPASFQVTQAMASQVWTVQDAQAVHEEFLRGVVTRCLLSPGMEKILIQVLKILDLAERFVDHAYDAEKTPDAGLSFVRRLRAEFEAQLSVLQTVATAILKKRTVEHLQDFLLRLQFSVPSRS